MRATQSFVLFAALVLGGCIGGGNDAPLTDSATPPSELPTSAPAVPAAPAEDVPKYHPHNYWGDRTQVYLFLNDQVTLLQDARKETSLQDDVVIIGYQEFDTSLNGDHSASTDYADVVMQGTAALVVKVDWAPDPTQGESIPGLTFKYKPANTPEYSAIENVEKGQEYLIPLKRGWADMAHQLKLSRWKFALEAYDPEVAALPVPAKVYAARGAATVTVRALNGGHESIDPPHPYNFLDGPERYAGEINQTVDFKVVNATVNSVYVGQEPAGWRVQAPHIIPWETKTVKAWLDWSYTGSIPAPHALGLSYTDASGTTTKAPPPEETGENRAYYEIPAGADETDDPYAAESVWTWGVHPIVNGNDDLGGEFAGSVHIRLVAVGDSQVVEG